MENQIIINQNTENYCSIKAESREEKVKLHKALTSPSKLSEKINQNIKIKDIVIEKLEGLDEETGEVTNYTNIIIVDDIGNAYQTTSKGILNALKTLVQIFGLPSYEEPIEVVIKQVELKNGRTFTFEVV